VGRHPNSQILNDASRKLKLATMLVLASTFPIFPFTDANNIRFRCCNVANTQTQATAFQLPDKSPKAAKESHSDALKRLNKLADDAQIIGDASARSRLSARIAKVLWAYDETRARLMFKFAFDRAVDIPKLDETRKEKQLTCGLVRAEIIRLWSEKDARSAAEQLLDGTSEKGCIYGPRNRANTEHPRSDLFATTAASIVRTDVDLAYRLGLMSLDDGITINIGELLNSLALKDEKLANQLLAACIDRIATKDVNALEIVDVARFLFGEEISPAPRQRAETNVEEKAAFKKAFGTKFLTAALAATDRFVSKIERQQSKEGVDDRVTDPEIEQVWNHDSGVKEVAASYYSMLLDIREAVRNYDPDKLGQTQSLLARVGHWMSPVDREHMLVFYDNDDTPESLAAEAEKASDAGQKSELYDLAAQLAQQKGDDTKALELAAKIDDEAKRTTLSDGFRMTRAFQAADKQDFTQARELVEMIKRSDMRLNALLIIVERMRPTSETNKREAGAWLEEAQSLLNTEPGAAHKAYTMMAVARAYTQIDPEAAFKTTARAIDIVNGLSGPFSADKEQWQFLRNNPSDPLSLFGSDTRLLESLARIDYVRTLGLAGRFNDPALVVASQLSIVRMNLPPVRN
jgi:hypothetical protein